MIKNAILYLIRIYVILILLLSLIGVVTINSSVTERAAAMSSWVQNDSSDFIAGTFNNVTIQQFDEIELVLDYRAVDDEFKSISKISQGENIVIDTYAGEVRLAQINNTYGGSKNDAGTEVKETTDGGFIIVGETSSYGNGNKDVWLIKTDSSGKQIWEVTFGGVSDDQGASVAQTSDGGYIIVGTTQSFGAGYADAWLIRTDPYGDLMWDKLFGGSEWDFGSSVLQASDGGFIIAGTTHTWGSGESDVWLIKTDSSGNEAWNTTFGGTDFDSGREVQQTADGGYIITGYTWSYGSGESDLWLLKTNSTGAYQWAQTFGGSDSDHGTSVQQTTDGGYIVVGYTWSFGIGNCEVLLVKTDSGGAEKWKYTYGFIDKWDYGNSVMQTADGGYIVAGESYGTEYDIYFLKTNDTGAREWEKNYDSSDLEGANSVSQTSDGGYVITGYTNAFNQGNWDVWLIKTDGSGDFNTDEGRIISSNLIQAPDIYLIDSFSCNVVLPPSTGMKIQFSTDSLTWYNSAGSFFAWNNLNDGYNYFDLGKLWWSNPYFFYKISFNADLFYVPVLKNISVTYHQYFLNGAFTSKPYKGETDNINWNSISWTANMPADTKIVLKLRSATNQSELLDKSFIGPDGTVISSYDTEEQRNIWSGHDGDSWIQYRAYFESDGGSTPDLKIVTITYNCYPQTELQMLSPDDQWITNSKPIFKWTFMDVDGEQSGFQVLIDDTSDFTSADYNSGLQRTSNEYWDLSEGLEAKSIPDGVWYWKVRTMDTDNDLGEYCNYSMFKLDTTPPSSLHFIRPDNWTSVNSPRIEYFSFDELSGIDHYLLNIDNSEFIEAGGTYTFYNLEDGEHTVSVQAYDKAGNYHRASVDLKIDTMPPLMEHAPVTSSEKNTPVMLSAVVTDRFSGVNQVTLYYRPQDESAYTALPMNFDDSTYAISIPGTEVKTGIDYYIEAVDNADPPNRVYFGLNGEIDAPPKLDELLRISISDDERKSVSTINFSRYYVTISIVIIAVIVFITWARVLSRRGLLPGPLLHPTPDLHPRPDSPLTKPVTFKRPHPKRKKLYFEQPPEMKIGLTQLLDENTAMIKFKCSHCGNKSIVQVSKEYHSVICPQCEKETPIGQEY